MKYSHKNGTRAKSLGFTMLEIILAMALMAIAAVAVAPAFKDMIGKSKTSKAAELQQSFNKWYSDWTHAGAVHSAATTNAAQTAYFLLHDVAATTPSTTGIANAGGADWVDETKLKVGGESIAGAIRLEIQASDFGAVDAGGFVMANDYYVNFTPTGKNTGAFTVTVKGD